MSRFVFLLSVAIIGCGQSVKQPNKESEQPIPIQKEVQYLDLRHLSTGQIGMIFCSYAEILKIIDNNSCIVLPYNQMVVCNSSGGGDLETTAYLPLMLKNLSTKDRATG